MQHLIPDMDDLYKKAGEEYPLKTDTPDWNSVYSKLQAFESQPKAIRTFFTGQRIKQAVAVFLLMILTGIFIIQSLNNRSTYQKVAINNVQKSGENPVINNQNNNSFSKDLSKNSISATENNLITNQKQKLNKSADQLFFSDKSIFSNNANENFNQIFQNDQSITSEEGTDIKEFYLAGFSAENIIKTSFTADLSLSFATKAIPVKKPVDVIDNPALTKADNLQYSTVITKPKRFYIGALVAPELISVRFQPINKTSFGLGGLIGYRMTNRLSLEAGIMLAHKYYYTDGRYIAANSIRRDNSSIISVNAYNNITELPLSFQYVIHSTNNNKFFAGLGAISYVIHKEQYSYLYTKDGEEKTGVKYNNKASRYWFSNAQVSLGFEHNLGNIGSLRAEPFYRIPLEGIGISDLRVTGFGVNIGLTKNIKL